MNHDSVERLINQKLDVFKLDLILDIKEMISEHCSKSLDCVADVKPEVPQAIVKPIYRQCQEIIFDCVPREPLSESMVEARYDNPHAPMGIYYTIRKMAPEFNYGTIGPTLTKLRRSGRIHSKAVTMEIMRKGKPVFTTGFVYWRD